MNEPKSSPKRFGPYEIHRTIGRGGMGSVHLAIDTRIGRTVALKALDREHLRQADHRLRFLREVRSVARLDHPHIVRVFEAGEEAGRLFFTMEYVEGETLQRAIRQRRLDFDRIARIFHDVAAALDHAHGRGIIHRDIKPNNILLDREGRAKVVDFGLAREIGRTDLTATGVIIGTPRHMAPEQIRGGGKKLGPACDLYGMGSSLYAALAGREPFIAETSMKTLEAILSAPLVPPRQIDRTVPRPLERICLRMMSRDPEARPADAATVVRELDRYRKGGVRLAIPRIRWPRGMGLSRWPRPVFAHLLLLGAILPGAVGVGIGVFEAWRESRSLADLRAALVVVEKRLAASSLPEDSPRVPEAMQTLVAEGGELFAAGREALALERFHRATRLEPGEVSFQKLEFARALLGQEGIALPGIGPARGVDDLGSERFGIWESGRVSIVDRRRAEVEGSFDLSVTDPVSVRFLDADRWLVLDASGNLRLETSEEGIDPFPFSFEGVAGAMAVEPGGDRFAFPVRGEGLRICERDLGWRPSAHLRGRFIEHLAFGPGGRLYAVDRRGEVWVIDRSNRAQRRGSLPRPVTGVRVDPGGAGLLAFGESAGAGSASPVVRRLLPGSGGLETRAVPIESGGAARRVEFHPAGSIVLALEEPGLLVLRRSEDLLELGRFRRPEAIVGFAFVLDGCSIALAGRNGVVVHSIQAFE